MSPIETPRGVADLLLARGRLTPRQHEQVRRREEKLGIPQHRALVELNYASEEEIYRALAEMGKMEFIDLQPDKVDRELLESVSLKLVFHHQMIPVSLEGELLTLAFSDPPRQMEIGNLRLLLRKRLKIVLATPSAIHAVVKQHFGLGAESVQKLREEKDFGEIEESLVFDVQGGDDDSAVDATISEFVDQLLREAIRLQATDIHIEPYPASIRLRYRIDGLLQSVPVPPDVRRLHAAVVSRIKIMAGLNIAEKRLPHDGRIAMKTAQEDYDVRVSIIPTKFGETLCLRILGRQNMYLDLGHLGMEAAQERLFSELVRLPQGLILVTGPTGSGKTTTLYSALAQASEDSRKTITIEDPVEYQLDGITQIQVREDIHLSFARGLRSVLRHDPDIVLVGEIRDGDTAEIAVRAAQTGHLVFSTLHTNDSLSSVSRLMDMGVDPFLVSASLVCSVAQRLTRRICRHCREEDPEMTPELRREMAETLKVDEGDVGAWRGAGCVECNQLGYRGRVAIYEFFLMTDALADLIEPQLKAIHFKEEARRSGWRSLREMALLKVQNGVTTLEEVQRVTRRIQARLPDFF